MACRALLDDVLQFLGGSTVSSAPLHCDCPAPKGESALVSDPPRHSARSVFSLVSLCNAGNAMMTSKNKEAVHFTLPATKAPNLNFLFSFLFCSSFPFVVVGFSCDIVMTEEKRFARSQKFGNPDQMWKIQAEEQGLQLGDIFCTDPDRADPEPMVSTRTVRGRGGGDREGGGEGERIHIVSADHHLPRWLHHGTFIQLRGPLNIQCSEPVTHYVEHHFVWLRGRGVKLVTPIGESKTVAKPSETVRF